MKKNNQPLILGIVVIGAVLIIVLALIFTRGDSDTEAPAENTTSENGENATNENGGEQTTPQPDPQPTPQPAPDPDPLPGPQPDPQPGVLPPNWNSLTDREKTNLNPFDCDHATQWVSAEDGSCISRTTLTAPANTAQLRAGVAGELTHLDCAPMNADSCFLSVALRASEDISTESFPDWMEKGTLEGPLEILAGLTRECVFIPAGAFVLTTEDNRVYHSQREHIYDTCFEDTIGQSVEFVHFVHFDISTDDYPEFSSLTYLSSGNENIVFDPELSTQEFETIHTQMAR